MENVIISAHAMERFKERYDKRNLGKNPLKTFKRLLSLAKEIKYTSFHNVVRLLNHGCTETKYFYHSGLIFVYVPEGNTIVTVEHQLHKQRGKHFVFVED